MKTKDMHKIKTNMDNHCSYFNWGSDMQVVQEEKRRDSHDGE